MLDRPAKRAKLDSSPDAAFKSSVEKLLEAVVAAGGSVCDGLSFRPGGAGLCVMALRDLEAGTVLARVPRELILSAATALDTPIGRLCSKHFRITQVPSMSTTKAKRPKEMVQRTVTYVFLIDARSQNMPAAAASPLSPPSALPAPQGQPTQSAPHAAYAGSLPAAFGLPLSWPEAALEELAGTPLVKEHHRVEQFLRGQFRCVEELCRLEPVAAPAERFSWDAFCWAHAAFTSRNFPLTSIGGAPSRADGRAGTAQAGAAAEADADADADAVADADADADGVLIPLLDLFNHGPGESALRWDSESNTLSLGCAAPVGTEILNHYGRKSNARFIVSYGMAQWGNPEDSFPLRIAALFPAAEIASAMTWKRKHNLFGGVVRDYGGRGGGAGGSGGSGGATSSFEVLLTRTVPIPPAAMAAARVCCCDEEEAAACVGPADALSQLSPKNEAAALRFLRELLQRRTRELWRGEESATKARIAALRAADAVVVGEAAFATTPEGCVAAYRDGLAAVLEAAEAELAERLVALA